VTCWKLLSKFENLKIKLVKIRQLYAMFSKNFRVILVSFVVVCVVSWQNKNALVCVNWHTTFFQSGKCLWVTNLGAFRVKFTRHIWWCKFGGLLKRTHFYISTTPCYPSMLRIVLLHIHWSCYTWHKIVRPSMGPHYQMDVCLLWRVAQGPSIYSQWPASIQRNLIIAGDTYLFMLLLIMEGVCPQFSLKKIL
jgi:hypothetical protein